jgi:hypothetical protein
MKNQKEDKEYIGINKNYYQSNLNGLDDKFKNKVPVKRGCKAVECFCNGSCKEIIGWRDRLPNEL